MVLLLVLALSTSTRATRVIYDLDHDWKFELKSGRPSGRCNGTDPFPQDLGTKQTSGLNQASAITESTCADACCGETSCETYQFCNVSSCGCGPPQQACCWIGKYTGAHTSTAKGWVSRARTVAPTPSPGPGPAATCSEAWCLPTTDDSKWRDVAIPHDFVVEGTFSETLGDKVHGYLPYGVGFYRKHLTLPSAHSGLIAGTHVATLVFDGVQTASKTYLDGEELGTHASGYTPFRYVLSAATAARLGSGASVLLAVEADATKPDGWWYDGGGIYRHVKLVVQPALHLAVHGGVYAPSLVVGAIDSTHPQLVADGVVMPSLTVVNADSAAASAVTVKCVVADAAGKAVGMVSSSIASIAAGKNVTTALQNITLPSAQLWSVEAPYLYTITCTVNNDDAVATKIGVRKTTWSADTGFWLNDVNVKIKGNANHQDFAGVGVAVPDILQAHRIAKLQEMGANGWRTAHNPPNPALLDAADAMGFLVWDENHRNGQDGELTDLVLRDRNHPCVVIWSICNEKLCKTGGDTLGDAQRMHDLFHTLDPHGQRPVSANYNGWDTTMTPLDLDGFDYETSTYDKNHKAVPNVPSISSETSSAVSDRGYYAADDATTGHVKGYDSDHPGWGQTAEDAWGGVTEPANQGILTRAFVAGGFTWTGWDYKGEPTPFAWPNINSHFGIIDEAGFPKDRFFWYQTAFKSWATGAGMVHVFPHWNWASSSELAALRAQNAPTGHRIGCTGMCIEEETAAAATVNVWAFTNGASAELFVNGASQGITAIPKFGHAQWQGVPFAPGNLTAVAYDANNKTLATQTRLTTGAAAALVATIKDGVGARSGGLLATCNDVALVMVEVVDAAGLVVPNAENNITFAFAATPALSYIGGGNGDPSCHVNDKAATRPAWAGLALGVFSSGDVAGQATVTVSSPGLKSATVTIKVRNPTTNDPTSWWCSREARL